MESRCSKLLIKKLNSIDIKNQWSLVVLNALTGMHAKCGDIVKARWVFDSIAYKDNISWNSMLTGYIRHGLLAGVLQVFPGMIQKGFEPDFVTISTILSSFSSLKTVAQIHG
ncbi:hypothetical protein PVK06_019004 [Gossypium arboreum]|uniref:Pentatricopeptide repeat-containing protein n=1 Tax=Gossypium arboreum TaxID=29729 RepID=A0ABR0PIU7_GOSAR|nr:hypothetical protein PVK06_019004 [Gossypium arboreum]